MLRNKIKISIGLILLTLFCGMSVFSQDSRTETSVVLQGTSKCQKYEDFKSADFVGEPISLNIVNADFRDILLYITEQYGYDFVIDKSVKDISVTLNVNNTSWKIVLENILKTNDLVWQVNCPFIKIITVKALFSEFGPPTLNESEFNNLPLYTEFVKLKNFPANKEKDDIGTINADSNRKVGLSKLYNILKKRLSKRGSIEVDCRAKVLILTDVKENLNALLRMVYYLDKSETYQLTEEEYKTDICNLSRESVL